MPFNFLLKPDATVQQKVLQIRREVVKTKPTSTGVKRNTLAPDTHGRNDRLQPLPRSGSTKRKSSPNRSKSPVKPLRRRTTPQPPINFGNDESDIEETTDTQRKKAKVGLSLDTDSKRRVRFDEGSSPNGKVDVFPMVHAADIIELDKSMKYIPAFAGLSANSEVSLQYPSTAQKERFVTYQLTLHSLERLMNIADTSLQNQNLVMMISKPLKISYRLCTQSLITISPKRCEKNSIMKLRVSHKG